MESIKGCSTAPASQQDSHLDHETEAQALQICARAGVACLGIQRGFGVASNLVLFQPISTTLALPLSIFAHPDEAIAAIKAKLAQSGCGGEK
jgi:hypothetical protein